MCGGGGSAGGTTRYEWSDPMAPYWGQTLQEGAALSDKPYEQYSGSRIAGLTGDQTDSMNNVRNFIANPGDFLYGKGNLSMQDTLDGKYLDGDKANPFSTANAYMGEGNPYFNDVLQQGRQGITDAYQQGTAADTTRMFNLSGAFGGSAHQNAVANNEAGLGKSLSQYTSGMQNDQYNRSAGMYENYLNRGSQNYEGERGRMMNAGQMSQNDQNLTLQRYNAQMGLGDINRSYNQDLLTQGYNDWQEQQNHPYKMNDFFSGLLGRAQGGISPNSTTSQSGYQASPYSQVLGAGLLGYSMMNK